MEVLYTILGIIIILIVVAILKGIGRGIEHASAQRQYDKAVQRSTGLEKIRLLVRRGAITFTLGLSKKEGEDESSNFSLSMPVTMAHMNFADSFYGQLDTMPHGVDAYSELAEKLSADMKAERSIEARVFGVAFGIVLAKAADQSRMKIKKTAVKKYLESCSIDKECKKDVIKMALLYIDYENDGLLGPKSNIPGGNGSIGSADVSKIALSLVDAPAPGEGHFADPFFHLAFDFARTYAYANADVRDSSIDDMKKEGLIG